MAEAEPIDPDVTLIDITPRPEEQSPARGRWRWTQPPLPLTIVAVFAAFVLGLLTPQRQITSPAHVEPVANIVSTGRQCSVQNGQMLQVGIEVANRGTATAEIVAVHANAPIGGLNLRDVGWGACGQLQDYPVGSTTAAGQPVRKIPPGGSEWMFALYDVPEDCPAPYPVQFLLDSVGSTSLLNVGGFSDLGNVPYSGCT
jgi:hypothetical protein